MQVVVAIGTGDRDFFIDNGVYVSHIRIQLIKNWYWSTDSERAKP